LWGNLPGTEDWITRLMARPAYQKALPLDDYRLPVASVV